MQFIGPPFIFGLSQVASNCGAVSAYSAVDVNGTTFWMSQQSFYMFDGAVRKIPCPVQDYVFDDFSITQQPLVYAGLNSDFNEITWFYASQDSDFIDRNVTYNYMDSSGQRPIWTIGSLARSTWADSAIFGKPHGTEYDSSSTSDATVGNTDGCTTYYEHETGTNQIKAGATTAIQASIESGDFDLDQKSLAGDGEYMMKIRRVIPDFLTQTGDARVTLNLKNYPTDAQASSSLGPFTSSTTTTKIDTRARARAISLKVDNTGLTQHWKLGTFRLDVQPDGRR